MCGINGFTFRDEELIAKMNNKTKHRGPDATGQFVDSKVSLGHNRLAILDLTPTGAQPMKSDDGSVVVVFNGEIYNFQELRKELEAEGQKFKGTSDTEVIVRGYEAWGINMVKKFNGIFAFALWDSKKEKLFLVRDQIGVKPLYYAENNGALIFSSEIKAILEHPIKREVNHEALNIYFRVLYVPAPITMFANILKLEPGYILTYERGVIHKESYWNPTFTTALSSKEEAKDLIKNILRDSVQRQMISERPVGVFLSGGVDSTVILGLAAEVSGKTLDTFSVGFETGGDKFNADARLARLTSEHYHTRHHELIIKNSDVREYLPEVIYHMDEPVANATQVATYLLSRFARESGIVVALGGDGGDELFGGYERYRLSQMISFYQGKIPVLTQSFLGRIMKWLPNNFREEVEMMTKAPGAPRLLAFMAQKEIEISGIFKSGINDTDVTAKWFERYFQPLNPDTENAFMMADIRSWLTDESLIRSDKLSMAWALEQRVPILDYRLVELSGKIPSSWKYLNIRRDWWDLYSAGKIEFNGIKHRVDFLVVPEGKDDMAEKRVKELGWKIEEII
jgi:asparagine synthase (glutamine-hydrolysing)